MNNLRQQLIDIALRWQKKYGVCPSITSSISEFDAASMIGMPLREYSEYMQDKTAVSKYKDFEYKGLKFQIKANRPSGKRGSKVTKVGHASKKSLEDNGWDILIWILYNEEFEIKETWVWNFSDYKKNFYHEINKEKPRLSPDDYRKGIKFEDWKKRFEIDT